MLGLYLFIITVILFAALVWFDSVAHRAIWMVPMFVIFMATAWAAGILLSCLATMTFLKRTTMRMEEVGYRR